MKYLKKCKDLKIFYLYFIMDIKYNDIIEIIPLNYLLTYSPSSINQKIYISDQIKLLKNFKIKAGDIILNFYRHNYENLQDIINDAIIIYDNYDEYINKYNPPYSNDFLAYIKSNLKIYRIEFFKNLLEILGKLSCEIIKKLIENKKTFKEIEFELFNLTKPSFNF